MARAGSGPRVLLVNRARLRWRAWPRLKRVLRAMLGDRGVRGAVHIVLVTDRAIQALHRRFLSLDSPTDVLTFPLGPADGSESGGVFGEVVLSVETARREALARGLPVEEEVALYAIHGALHLLGLDDLEAGPRRAMRAAERVWMAAFRSEPGPPRERRRAAGGCAAAPSGSKSTRWSCPGTRRGAR